MSDTSSGMEEENGSLSDDWTMIDHDDSVRNQENNQSDNDEDEDGVSPPTKEEEEEEEEEEIEVTEEEEEEDAPTKGQRVEEVKGDADTESLSSEGSPEEKVRRRRTEKPEATQDEETDLSLDTQPSLPEDLPQIRPDPQYVHTPQEKMNHRLNMILTLCVALVVGLGIGHFLGIIDLSEEVEPGWSRRSLFDETLNAKQILETLDCENEELQIKISELQAENTEPFKIRGKEGKEARLMREKISHLITENEDMRGALSKHQFSELPDADKGEFNKLSQENYYLRTSYLKLKHLVPDNNKLENSVEYLMEQYKDLVRKVGQIRYQQPHPKELTPMLKQLEEMRTVVAQEAKKKNPPSSIYNAKSYLTYMGQIFNQFTFLHEWDEKSASEKIDLANDIFQYWLPRGVKLSTKTQEDVVKARGQFNNIKSSLRKKWKQLKDLTNPDTIVNVGQSTVTKMNRVIVNVVNKMKEIGQTTIMNTNKQLETSVFALFAGLAKLNKQFDETWKSLEIRIAMAEKYDTDIEDNEDDDDDDENNDENDDNDDDTENDNEGDVIDDYIKGSSTPDKDESVKEAVEVKKPAFVAPEKDKKIEAEVKPVVETKKIKEEVHKQIYEKEIENIIENIKGKDKHKKDDYRDKRRDYGKDKKVEIKKEEKSKPPMHERKYKKETPEEKRREFHKEEKIVKEDKKEERKPLADRIKDKQMEEEKHTKEEARYFKGQYNKFDKVKEESNKVPASDYAKKHKRQHDDVDDDEDEDDNEDVQKSASGLKRHWEKPQKKNYFREHSGPKKQFIRRRGKEDDESTGGDKRKKGKDSDKKDKRGKEVDKRDKRGRDIDKKGKDWEKRDKKDSKRVEVNKKEWKKDDKRINENKEYKNNNKVNRWNDKSKEIKSKFIPRENKNKIKIGFDFKKGKYHNREKFQPPKSKKVKYLKSSDDMRD